MVNYGKAKVRGEWGEHWWGHQRSQRKRWSWDKVRASPPKYIYTKNKMKKKRREKNKMT